jgi:hypothetical protein
MVLKGNVAIRVSRKQAWGFLTDPNQIGQCVPGVEKIEIIFHKNSQSSFATGQNGNKDRLRVKRIFIPYTIEAYS